MKILFLTTCLLLILIAGSGQDLRDTAVENTFFWKITSPALAQPSYLYGTMHKTCATDVWFSPLLLEILRSCKIFYNETLDIRILKDSAILIGKPKNGMQDFLGRNYFRSGRKILEKYYGAFTKEQLDNMGTTEFADRLIEACHECRVISYDDSLYNLASQNNLAIRGLEKLDEIIKFMPERLHLTPGLDWFKNYISYPGINRRAYLRDISYYKKHDINWLYNQSAFKRAGGESSIYKENYIDGRNRLWLPRMEEAMKEASSFFAVGCAHLPGFNGIITLLRKKGYTVTPLFYPGQNP